MEAARDLTALTCGGAERGPGVELERTPTILEGQLAQEAQGRHEGRGARRLAP